MAPFQVRQCESTIALLLKRNIAYTAESKCTGLHYLNSVSLHKLTNFPTRWTISLSMLETNKAGDVSVSQPHIP